MTELRVKLLVVDDEVAIRRLLRVGLLAEGFDIAEASNGRTARERIKANPPDLNILDLGLPDIEGQTSLKDWRHEGVDLALVARQLRSKTVLAAIRAASSETELLAALHIGR